MSYASTVIQVARLFCLHQDPCCCARRKPKKSRQCSPLPFQAFSCGPLVLLSRARLDFSPCLLKLTQPMSCGNICADLKYFSLSGNNIRICRTMPAQRLRSCVYTHTPRSDRRGVSTLKTQLTATRNTLGQEDGSRSSVKAPARFCVSFANPTGYRCD